MWLQETSETGMVMVFAEFVVIAYILYTRVNAAVQICILYNGSAAMILHCCRIIERNNNFKMFSNIYLLDI